MQSKIVTVIPLRGINLKIGIISYLKPKMTIEQEILRLGQKQSIVTHNELLKLGISTKAIEELIASNILSVEVKDVYSIEQSDWGKYHASVKITAKYPVGIICLANALTFHECTTQMPGQVTIAVPNQNFTRSEQSLPIRFVYMDRVAYHQGINVHIIEGRPVKIYSLAKTIVDCFEFSEHVGMEVAYEAVEESFRTKRITKNEVLAYAKDRCFDPEVEEDFTRAIAHPEQIYIFI